MIKNIKYDVFWGKYLHILSEEIDRSVFNSAGLERCLDRAEVIVSSPVHTANRMKELQQML
jgi:hypothetical protein